AAACLNGDTLAALFDDHAFDASAFGDELNDARLGPAGDATIAEREEEAAHQGVPRRERRITAPARALKISEGVAEHLPRHKDLRLPIADEREVRLARRDAEFSED